MAFFCSPTIRVWILCLQEADRMQPEQQQSQDDASRASSGMWGVVDHLHKDLAEFKTTISSKLDSILDALRTSDVVHQPCGNVQAVGFPDRTEFHLSEHHEHNNQPQRYRIQVLRPLIGTSNSNVMSCGRCRFKPRLIFSFTFVQSMRVVQTYSHVQ